MIDEGRCKNNSLQNCSILGNLLDDRKILYKSSKEEPPLQLADFTAFTLNRFNWLMMKEGLNEYDKEFLEIVSFANFNAPFSKKVEFKINNDLKQRYEQFLDASYDRIQSYPELSLDDFRKHCIIP